MDFSYLLSQIVFDFNRNWIDLMFELYDHSQFSIELKNMIKQAYHSCS